MLLASSTPLLLLEKLILNVRVCKYSRNTDKKHLYMEYTFPLTPPVRCLDTVQGDADKRCGCLFSIIENRQPHLLSASPCTVSRQRTGGVRGKVYSIYRCFLSVFLLYLHTRTFSINFSRRSSGVELARSIRRDVAK